MRTLLLISPYFPPMGVSGAKRALHLARNLPEFGWRPAILASPAVTEAVDESLMGAVPPDLEVSYGYGGRLRPALQRLSEARNEERGRGSGAGPSLLERALGWDPAFLTPFDRFLADTPAGIRAALDMARRVEPDAIAVSSDPWSPLIAALFASRRTGLPLVVDFRDPWSLHEGKMALRPPPTRRLLEAFERCLFEEAAAVILNTEECRGAYAARYAGRIPSERFEAVRNAFDPGLFEGPPGEEPAGDRPFTVTYFGRFRRFVGPDALVRGFERFARGAGLGPAEARLTFVGGLGPAERDLVEECGLGDYVSVEPSVPFCESLSVLRSADALALVVQPECRLQIPGKLYDYLCAGRPILAISANDEVDRIVEETGAGLSARYGDPSDVAARLAQIRDRAESGRPIRPDPEKVERFSAREQARSYARILDGVVLG